MTQNANSSLVKVIAALDIAGIAFDKREHTIRITDTKADAEGRLYGRRTKPVVEVDGVILNFSVQEYGGSATLYFVKDTGAYVQKLSRASYPFHSNLTVSSVLQTIEHYSPAAVEARKAKLAAQDAERAAAYIAEVAEAHAEAQRERLVAQGVLFEALKAEGLNDAQASAVVIMVQAQEANPITELIAAAHKANRRAQGYLDNGRHAPSGLYFKDGKPVVTV